MQQSIRNWVVTYLNHSMVLPTATPYSLDRAYYQHVEVLTAPTREALLTDLEIRLPGSVCLEVKEIKPRRRALFDRHAEYRHNFLLSMVYLVEAGTSPGRALEVIIAQDQSELRGQLNDGLRVLRQGRTFIEAFETIRLFDSTTLNLVAAGERTGQLAQALRSSMKHLQKRNTMQKLLLGALLQPITVLDIIGAVMGIFGSTFFLIPEARDALKHTGHATDDLMAIVNWANVANNVMLGLTVLMAMAAFLVAHVYTNNDELPRARMDARMLRIPVLGDLMMHSAISSTATVVATLLRGGVAFPFAADMAAKATRLGPVTNYWRTMFRRVHAGEPVNTIVGVAPMSPDEQMVLRTHTSYANLAEQYEGIAAQRDERAQRAAAKFGSRILVASIVYAVITTLISAAVLYAQNKGAMSAGT